MIIFSFRACASQCGCADSKPNLTFALTNGQLILSRHYLHHHKSADYRHTFPRFYTIYSTEWIVLLGSQLFRRVWSDSALKQTLFSLCWKVSWNLLTSISWNVCVEDTYSCMFFITSYSAKLC